MRDRAYLGIGRWMVPVPGTLWRRQISSVAAGIARANARFMTDERRRLHHAVVRELAETTQPLETDYLAAVVGLSVDRVREILGELERRLTFLVRNSRGAVTWAYPMTVETTGHHVTFESGERLDAA